MDEERLVVFTKEISGQTGLALCVLDDDATVADLLLALAPFNDDTQLYKSHHPQRHGTCCGCPENCCTTSLIAPDLNSLLEIAKQTAIPLEQLTRILCDKDDLAQGYIVFQSFPCIFLHEDRCTIYDVRPLICRLFLCTRLSEELQDLIHAIIRRGLAEVASFLPGLHGKATVELLGDHLGGTKQERYRREFSDFYRQAIAEDWGPALHTGRYNDWKLRELCMPGQWKRLTRRSDGN